MSLYVQCVCIEYHSHMLYLQYSFVHVCDLHCTPTILCTYMQMMAKFIRECVCVYTTALCLSYTRTCTYMYVYTVAVVPAYTCSEIKQRHVKLSRDKKMMLSKVSMHVFRILYV